MHLQIYKQNSDGGWELAWGLKPRSFPRAQTESYAIEAFQQSTKRCRNYLILCLYPDFGSRPTVIAQVNVPNSLTEKMNEINSAQELDLLIQQLDAKSASALQNLWDNKERG
ncbi:hypothetical protein [Vibrio penaeicida]|uniref:hypothetical protein n=1 Tax=Vibrio penaeicida TaxID=104609 RepID=UPI001CC52414|nr:hypothetical protein [Vibrio penaeicida]